MPDAPGLELILAEINREHPEAVLDTSFDREQAALIVDPSKVIEVLTWLKETPGQEYTFLSSVHGADYFPRSPRFAVHYELLNRERYERLRVKAVIQDPAVGAEPVGDAPGRLPAGPGVPGTPPTDSTSGNGDEEHQASEAGVVGGPDGTPGEVRPAGPPSSAAPAEAPAPEPFDLPRLEQVWPAVLDSLAAAASGMVASYFEGTLPAAMGDSKITVGFPADAAFNRRNAERPECRQQLAEAIGTVTGERFQVEYGSLESGQQPATDPESEVMKEEDFVARVKSEFNAEEVI